MAAAIPFIMMAGAAISAIGAIKQGQAAKAAADFNATVNQQNAGIARQEARDLAQQHDRETYQRLGAIRAAQGHAGGTNEGSVLDVLADTASQSELERQQIMYRGELKARGYLNTATLDTFQGETAKDASYMKAGSELLGGASRAYGNFQRA
jgi:hypothetical protein